MNIADLREEYSEKGIRRADMHADPIQQFDRWFSKSKEASLVEPNAFTLATVDSHGAPDARTLLLKGYDADGFYFFTNQKSTKAQHIAHNNNVALLVHWIPLERQVRILGTATKVSKAQAAEYFSKRPRKSQLGAWCSTQSTKIESREALEAQMAEYEQKFAGQDIPLPEFWGGYCVKPHTIEFWQGRANRLHDRFVYKLGINKTWRIDRLSP